MHAGTQVHLSDLWLGLAACERLAREARESDVPPAHWTLEELDALFRRLAAELVARELDVI